MHTMLIYDPTFISGLKHICWAAHWRTRRGSRSASWVSWITSRNISHLLHYSKYALLDLHKAFDWYVQFATPIGGNITFICSKCNASLFRQFSVDNKRIATKECRYFRNERLYDSRLLLAKEFKSRPNKKKTRCIIAESKQKSDIVW